MGVSVSMSVLYVSVSVGVCVTWAMALDPPT